MSLVQAEIKTNLRSPTQSALPLVIDSHAVGIGERKVASLTREILVLDAILGLIILGKTSRSGNLPGKVPDTLRR